jgi:FtsP/CotA-like multicopper oxidase with cupredoxin domain
MRVAGAKTSGSIPVSIDPGVARLNPDLSMFPQRTLQLSMGQGQGYINGIAFQDMDHAYKITSMVGMEMMPSYEVWTVTNASGMDHPFHQHVDRVQVLSISGADASYPPYASMPAWKDTVLIPKWGSAKLLVPIKDFDGMTMFHCHILEHEDIGMMGVWDRMGMAM